MIHKITFYKGITSVKGYFSFLKWRILLSMLLLWASAGMYASTIHWITFINTNDPNVGELDDNARKVLYDKFVNKVSSEVSKYGYDANIYDYYWTVFKICNVIVLMLSYSTSSVMGSASQMIQTNGIL